jgi:hypothetical protein
VLVNNAGSTTGPTPVVTVADLKAFLETAGTPDIRSMTSDSSGNLFFLDLTTRNMLRLDPQGRLAKVVSKTERDAFYVVTTNNNTLRMQPRTVTLGGGAGSFSLTQVMYEETSGINAVSGAYNFKTGDFNRDNLVNQTDIAAFKSKLTVKAGPALPAADARYDLNGNGICSFKDLKTLQQFYPFFDGDANIDKVVDTLDFNALAGNFGGAGKVWTQADFNGDEVVDTLDFNFLAANFGRTAAAGAGAAEIGATVPEPGVFGVFGLAALAIARRTSVGTRARV